MASTHDYYETMNSFPHGRYPSDDERFIVFPSRRSVVHSTKGIVSTASPLATQAGLRILRDGGNAAVNLPFTI